MNDEWWKFENYDEHSKIMNNEWWKFENYNENPKNYDEEWIVNYENMEDDEAIVQVVAVRMPVLETSANNTQEGDLAWVTVLTKPQQQKHQKSRFVFE